jgi:hypothetical protein
VDFRATLDTEEKGEISYHFRESNPDSETSHPIIHSLYSLSYSGSLLGKIEMWSLSPFPAVTCVTQFCSQGCKKWKCLEPLSIPCSDLRHTILQSGDARNRSVCISRPFCVFQYLVDYCFFLEQSIASMLRAGRSNLGGGKSLFSSTQRPDRLCGPPSLLSNVYRDPFPR